jgi:hypothetical protein
MRAPRNPTVHVSVEDTLEPLFHSTTRCPLFPWVTESMPRSRARRAGHAECPRCFEVRMQQVEPVGGATVTEGASRPSASSTSASGFSEFSVR